MHTIFNYLLLFLFVVLILFNTRSSFSEFASKYGKDERFKAVEKMRDREQMFTDFLAELKKGGSKQREEHKPAPSSSAKGRTDKERQVYS